MNPYILQPQQMQDVGGLQPVFQNFGQQQANQQALLAQQNQLAGQAGHSQGGAGVKSVAVATFVQGLVFQCQPLLIHSCASCWYFTLTKTTIHIFSTILHHLGNRTSIIA